MRFTGISLSESLLSAGEPEPSETGLNPTRCGFTLPPDRAMCICLTAYRGTGRIGENFESGDEDNGEGLTGACFENEEFSIFGRKYCFLGKDRNLLTELDSFSSLFVDVSVN